VSCHWRKERPLTYAGNREPILERSHRARLRMLPVWNAFLRATVLLIGLGPQKRDDEPVPVLGHVLVVD
jgi:hypothetical protein